MRRVRESGKGEEDGRVRKMGVGERGRVRDTVAF